MRIGDMRDRDHASSLAGGGRGSRCVEPGPHPSVHEKSHAVHERGAVGCQPDGRLDYIVVTRQNMGGLHTQGVDTTFNYAIPTASMVIMISFPTAKPE